MQVWTWPPGVNLALRCELWPLVGMITPTLSGYLRSGKHFKPLLASSPCPQGLMHRCWVPITFEKLHIFSSMKFEADEKSQLSAIGIRSRACNLTSPTLQAARPDSFRNKNDQKMFLHTITGFCALLRKMFLLGIIYYKALICFY
jgi:hypothetical protein